MKATGVVKQGYSLSTSYSTDLNLVREANRRSDYIAEMMVGTSQRTSQCSVHQLAKALRLRGSQKKAKRPDESDEDVVGPRNRYMDEVASAPTHEVGKLMRCRFEN